MLSGSKGMNALSDRRCMAFAEPNSLLGKSLYIYSSALASKKKHKVSKVGGELAN